MNAESLDEFDRRFMAGALKLGRTGHGRTWPNPSVGCLIVRSDGAEPRVVGCGVTAHGGRPHAETQALSIAGAAARGATAYVTLEPCSHVGKTPPCADALIGAGISRVVTALGDPDPRVAGRGIARLRAAGIEVRENVLADRARRDHAGHLARVRFGRPFVLLKMAVTADGKAGRAGERVAITGPEANLRVHRLRARFDAIAVGIGTVLTDDPQLTVRLAKHDGRQPVRVVFDPTLRMPLAARLVTTAREVPTHIVAAFGADATRAARLGEAGVVVHLVPPPWLAGGGVNLAIALRELSKIGITRLLLEGGPKLAAAFLAQDLVDEAIVLTSPRVLGPEGIAARTLGPLDALATFAEVGYERLGDDSMQTYRKRR